MKTKFLLLAMLFCCGAISFAQNVNIPDAAFKAALVGNPAINTNGDNEIQVSEASSYADGIEVSGLGISDLTGIEVFIGITRLSCDFNQLNFLNVSNNIALTDLTCSNNQLTSLDVSNNVGIINLYCSYNQLSSLDVSNNTELRFFNCSNNQVTSLDISNNTVLVSLHCSFNLLNDLDVSNNIILNDLICGNNQLSSLDVSNNLTLKELDCSANQLTSLDISNNTALTDLYCSHNQLTSLDISNNTALTDLYCGPNSNLSCIQVWDIVYANTTWTVSNINIDPQMYFSLDCNNVSTAENISSYFTFSPNPASDYLYIDSKGEKNVSFTISDIWGRSIEAWQDKTEVPISHLPVGVYFLTAQIGDKTVVKKFVKE